MRHYNIQNHFTSNDIEYFADSCDLIVTGLKNGSNDGDLREGVSQQAKPAKKSAGAKRMAIDSLLSLEIKTASGAVILISGAVIAKSFFMLDVVPESRGVAKSTR